jgi:squalene synthase HpnD
MTALGAAQDDLDAVETVVRNAGTSFYRGMRILPPDRRMAMYAIYAFCRLVDDIADDPAPFETILPRLNQWRARIAALFRGGEPEGAIERVLACAIAIYHLRQQDFEAVIDGMQMDAETVIVAPDLATLDLYCDRVAAAVGRMSVRVFGDDSAGADEVAWYLGRALQLTNILRDVAEDAGRGRLYLPREYLMEAGVPLGAHEALTHQGLPEVCERLALDAHMNFTNAWAAMKKCDARAMKPARVMGASYAEILAALERRGWERFAEKVKVPKWRKLWIVLRFAWL